MDACVRGISNVPFKGKAEGPLEQLQRPHREKNMLGLFMPVSFPFRKANGSDSVRPVGVGVLSDYFFHTF